MGHLYKSILCPIDFDDNSMAALAHAGGIAGHMDATLHLLHVLPILPLLSDGGVAPATDEAAEKDATRRMKEIVRRRLPRASCAIHTRVAFVSDVARSILTAARDLEADLIVMATHGRSGIMHIFFGSVAEAVVRNATCPVLTLRPGHEERPPAANKRTKAPKRKQARRPSRAKRTAR